MIFTPGFWKDTAERVILGAATGALTSWGANSVEEAALALPQWEVFGVGAAGGALFMLVVSIVAGTTSGGSPSVAGTSVPAASVVERVTPTKVTANAPAGAVVVAGKGHDYLQVGKTIRTPDGGVGHAYADDNPTP